jgi:NhaP-type Na+/H+ or K+/H+ antiporter
MSHLISNSKNYYWIPEAAIIILIGFCVSNMLSYMDKNSTPFELPSDIFFQFLLPPIVFNSGLKINVQSLYKNLTPIMVFSALGTAYNSIIIGVGLYLLSSVGLSTHMSMMECLAFGSLISATDPVMKQATAINNTVLILKVLLVR